MCAEVEEMDDERNERMSFLRKDKGERQTFTEKGCFISHKTLAFGYWIKKIKKLSLKVKVQGYLSIHNAGSTSYWINHMHSVRHNISYNA